MASAIKPAEQQPQSIHISSSSKGQAGYSAAAIFQPFKTPTRVSLEKATTSKLDDSSMISSSSGSGSSSPSLSEQSSEKVSKTGGETTNN